VVKELIQSLRESRERGEDPGVGRTAKPVTGSAAAPAERSAPS